MITVKQAKEMGVVFVEGDKCREINLSKCYADGWYLHTDDKIENFNNCQIISFTERPHNGGEIPCCGDLPVVVEVIDGDHLRGLAHEYTWDNDGTIWPIVKWKPDLKAMGAILKDKEDIKIGMTNSDNSLFTRGTGELKDPMDSLDKASKAAIKTLQNLGCEYNGAEFWKPPVATNISEVTKAKTAITYELVTDLTTNEIAKAMIDGEVFYDGDGHEIYKWSGYCFEDNCGRAITIGGNFYRKVEKQINWREEVAAYVNSKFTGNALGVSDNGKIITIKHSAMRDQSFLEMCRVALRATGELE